jgi:AbrB family looped-hinge helix DNA binding protein
MVSNEPLNSQINEYRKVQGLVGESSFSIVLPKSFAIALGIGKGDFVKVYTEDKKIIVERAK